MKIPLPAVKRNATEDMLPLINIVFLLIVFFLASGRLALDGTSQGAATSSSSSTGDAGGESATAGTVIALDAKGHARWNGAPIDDAALASKAIIFAQQHPHDGLAVQADARTPADRVVEIFTTLQSAGVAEVHLLAAVSKAKKAEGK